MAELFKTTRLWQNIKPMLFGTIGTVALLNGSVALFAFIKDVLIATCFGTSLQADGLTLAYFLPDTIGNNLTAAALGVSCVSVFAQIYAMRDRERLIRHVRISLLVFSIFSLSVMIGLYIYSENISGWLTGSGISDLSHLTLILMRIILPIVIIFPLISIGNALLQTTGVFSIPAAAPLISHVMIIIAVLGAIEWGLTRKQTVYLVSIAISLGAIVMAVATWVAITRTNPLRSITHNPENRNYISDATIKRSRRWQDQLNLWRIFVPYLFILLSSQTVFLVERKLASGMETGTLAGLNYAFRLSQFPIWVFVAAVYSVVLPSLSKDLALNRMDKLQSTISKAFKDILLVTIPTTILLYFLRVPIISALLQRGAFDAESVRITSSMLKGYALSIIGVSLSAVCLRYFLAAGKTMLPFIVTVISSCINIAADYYLKDTYGAAGLGYGAAIGATVSAILFLLSISGALRLSYIMAIKPLTSIIMANVIPCLIIILISKEWKTIPSYVNGMARICILVCVVGLCMVVYYATLRKFKMLRSL